MATQDPIARDPRIDARTRNGRIKMLLLLLFCASPVIVSYLAYYVFKPAGGKTNYGTLIDPQRPVPAAVQVVDEQIKTFPLVDLKGQWLMLSVDSAACDEACVKKLFEMRQFRIGQGKERERIVPVWLITDEGKIDPRLIKAYNDEAAAVRFLHTSLPALQAWLPVEEGHRMQDYLYLVDPLGNLMMLFPKDPDPAKVRGDLTKLLKYNRVG